MADAATVGAGSRLDGALAERRLATLRTRPRRSDDRAESSGPARRSRSRRAPGRGASTAEVVADAARRAVVRIETAPRSTCRSTASALGRLARPSRRPDVPLVCLDTETTGLATAAGTVAFLVGLGWWDGTSFRQVQLLLPDQADEPALLEALAALIPADAWLVTYNGRGFDWPLLVARYRMDRRARPPLAGHLDLLPFVRRVFRHRMTDARLKTVEDRAARPSRATTTSRAGRSPAATSTSLARRQRGRLVDVVPPQRRTTSGRSRGLLAHLDRTPGATRCGAAAPRRRPGRPRATVPTSAPPRRGARLPRCGPWRAWSSRPAVDGRPRTGSDAMRAVAPSGGGSATASAGRERARPLRRLGPPSREALERLARPRAMRAAR